MQDTDQLRLKALQCRRLAASIGDIQARDALTGLALDFEARAQALEVQAAAETPVLATEEPQTAKPVRAIAPV